MRLSFHLAVVGDAVPGRCWTLGHQLVTYTHLQRALWFIPSAIANHIKEKERLPK